MSQLLVLGGGVHARVLIEALLRAERRPIGIVDSDPALRDQTILGIAVIGGDGAVLTYDPGSVRLVNGVGNRATMESPGLENRRAIFERFSAKGYSFAQVVSRDASVASDLTVGEGAQIMAGSVVQPGCRIDANSIVNSGAIVEHDCTIGAHSHIAPGAILCGGVTVGSGSHVGAGAVVLQGIRIGDGVVIGAGAVVRRDVKSGAAVTGRAEAAV